MHISVLEYILSLAASCSSFSAQDSLVRQDKRTAFTTGRKTIGILLRGLTVETRGILLNLLFLDSCGGFRLEDCTEIEDVLQNKSGQPLQHRLLPINVENRPCTSDPKKAGLAQYTQSPPLQSTLNYQRQDGRHHQQCYQASIINKHPVQNSGLDI